MTQADPSIEQFVRGALGCGCPDDVFLSVELSAQPATPGRPGYQRLLIGQRLLICIVEPEGTQGLAEAVRALAAEGRAQRDALGLNRFRLVVALDVAEAARAAAAAAFHAVAGGDERAHLHLLAPTELPAVLSSRGTRDLQSAGTGPRHPGPRPLADQGSPST
ncbi:MAG: hypothetical protein MUC71_00345 [Steroidobacteraceae bacterium]|jgi:hypothetical protein|nr:hypothetical protein [Steroidobacteraceae bacterium]